jgi:hypothetical protein
LGDFEANQVHFGQKLALPKLLKNTIVLYAYSVLNAYFTVLNVPNYRMTHPWLIPIYEKVGTVARGMNDLPIIRVQDVVFYASHFGCCTWCGI